MVKTPQAGGSVPNQAKGIPESSVKDQSSTKDQSSALEQQSSTKVNTKEEVVKTIPHAGGSNIRSIRTIR